jgi:hypothetical protein
MTVRVDDDDDDDDDDEKEETMGRIEITECICVVTKVAGWFVCRRSLSWSEINFERSLGLRMITRF